jgi:D-serine deaminase-like pyridoxal phosphate-dependent protein
MLTTLVGLPVAALDTPALLVDTETMDRNIAHIAETMREAGVNWRPHAKGHKCPTIAHRQIAAGAIGVTLAKVSEAEVMAAHGIRDILIANQVVGEIKTRRLAALIAATGADVIVAVDNPANVRELDDAAARARTSRPCVLPRPSPRRSAGAANRRRSAPAPPRARPAPRRSASSPNRPRRRRAG